MTSIPSRLEAAREALQGLLVDIGEYQAINNLGGGHTHWQTQAKQALATFPTAEELAAWGKEESGWVIELAASEPCSPQYWAGSSLWVPEHLKALRFARKQDAQQAADFMLDGMNIRICVTANHAQPKPVNADANYWKTRYLLLKTKAPEPVSLEKCAKTSHDAETASYGNFHRWENRTAEIQEEYRERVKVIFDAAGVPYAD